MGTNPVILDCLKGARSSKRTPVWFMRQAGRYLPEYRKLREKHKLIEMMTNPELACEVTLQPLERFDLDAAIIFADILTPLMTLGVNLDFQEGVGPVLDVPGGISSMIEREPDMKGEVAPFTTRAISMVSAKLKGRDIPVIGFCGAPLTLAAYLLEDRTAEKRALIKTKELLRADPVLWQKLMIQLSDHLVRYLLEQVEAGAQVLQIFDSWIGGLDDTEFRSAELPYLEKIVSGVKAKCDVPIIYFGLGNTGHLPYLSKLPVDCFSIDWTTGLLNAQTLLGGKRVLQGNLDPTLLLQPFSTVLESRCETILAQGRELAGHVFNVGHGFLPTTSIETVTRVIETVRRFDAAN